VCEITRLQATLDQNSVGKKPVGIATRRRERFVNNVHERFSRQYRLEKSIEKIGRPVASIFMINSPKTKTYVNDVPRTNHNLCIYIDQRVISFIC